MTKSALLEQYFVIEEIINELNSTLLEPLCKEPAAKFIPTSYFIAQVIMVHKMMLLFVELVETTGWEDEFLSLYKRTKRHLLTTELMLQELIN